MLSGIHFGKSSGCRRELGTSSHFHQPNRASQIRVKTRAEAMPPRSRIQAAALAMCGSSGASPASRRATYASMVVDSSPGPP